MYVREGGIVSDPERDTRAWAPARAVVHAERHGGFDLPVLPAWYDDALCAQVDQDMFFPDRGGSTAAAKATCALCSVRQQCLDYALANHERYGIWGGVSERDRRKIDRSAS
jgi:WhiB family redox-sensing transcriptional regulator